ncbi:MAG: hypothetical protein ACRDP6_48505 [Actinoallomurus sp.]
MEHLRERPSWWVYVTVAVGVNIVRQVVFPPSEVGTFWTVTLFVAVLAFTAGVVFIGHRVARRLTRSRT